MRENPSAMPDIDSDHLGQRIVFEDLPPDGLWVRLRADSDDRRALAELLSVLSVESVEADLRLQWIAGENRLVEIDGTVRAALTQRCVVTLEPLAATLEGDIAIRFTDQAEQADQADESDDGWESDAEEDDPPEYAADGIIDLGDLVAQQLALEVDPFPRTEGLAYQDISVGGDDDDAEAEKPFAGLAALRDKLRE